MISVLRALGSIPAATRDNAQVVEGHSTASWYSPSYAGDPNQAPNQHSPDSTGINVFVQSLTVQNLRWVRQATVYKTLCLTHTLKSDWSTKLTYKNQIRTHTPINT